MATSVPAKGFPLYYQEVHIRVFVRLAARPGAKKDDPLGMNLGNNPSSHPINHIVGDIHHNDTMSGQGISRLPAGNYSRFGGLYKDTQVCYVGHLRLRLSF
jgi:hypothetical protein